MKKSFSILLLISLLLSCNRKDKYGIPENVQTTHSGIKYVFHTKHDNKQTYQKGQYISYDLRVQTKDYLLFDSFNKTNEPINRLILPDSVMGNEWEMFYQCAEGDSLEFWVSIDTLKNKSGILHPQIMESEGYMHFTLKVLKIENSENIELIRKEELITAQQQNQKDIEDYIKRDSTLSNMKPTDDGLFYQINKVGKGDFAQLGDTVLVNFTGKLLNGRILDSSQNRGEATELILGSDSDVIKGLDIGIRLLKEGGKGTFLIPSHLGFGTEGITDVVPKNAVLYFEVELMKIK